MKEELRRKKINEEKGKRTRRKMITKRINKEQIQIKRKEGKKKVRRKKKKMKNETKMN